MKTPITNNSAIPTATVSAIQKAFINKPINSLHSFYLSGSIEEASEYIQWFEVMRNCGENVGIHIQAHVICSVEGACMSAATMVFLCADTFEVSEHSVFMFHNYSSHTFGKGGEMYDNIMHERKWSEHLLKRIYDSFLHKPEIESLLDNKDIWMDGEEVLKRLTERQKSFAKKQRVVKPKAEKPKVEKIAPVAAKKPRAKKIPVIKDIVP